MKVGEEYVSRLQEEMIEVHDWREKYMADMDRRFAEVDAHFKRDDEAFVKYQNQVEETF